MTDDRIVLVASFRDFSGDFFLRNFQFLAKHKQQQQRREDCEVLGCEYRLSELIRQEIVEALGDVQLVVTQSTTGSTADRSA